MNILPKPIAAKLPCSRESDAANARWIPANLY